MMDLSIKLQQTLWTRQRKTCIQCGWTTCPQTAGTCSEWCLWTGTDPLAPRLSRVKSKREVGCQSEIAFYLLKSIPPVVLLIKWQFQGNVISWPTILSMLYGIEYMHFISKNISFLCINKITKSQKIDIQQILMKLQEYMIILVLTMSGLCFFLVHQG